jgi:hypothetical protein
MFVRSAGKICRNRGVDQNSTYSMPVESHSGPEKNLETSIIRMRETGMSIPMARERKKRLMPQRLSLVQQSYNISDAPQFLRYARFQNIGLIDTSGISHYRGDALTVNLHAASIYHRPADLPIKEQEQL